MFNIEFTAGKTDTVVTAEIRTNTECEKHVLCFHFNATYQYAAQLTRSHCEDEFRKAVRNLVKRAYMSELSDGRAKRRIKTEFVDTIVPLDDIGW